jgi:uncharacterized protein
MFAFLLQGAYERLWEIVSGHRLPKVVGLFLMGYLIGKHRLYARLNELPLRQLCIASLAISLPTSAAYAWIATHEHSWGLTVHSTLYAVTVIPLAFGYITGLCLLFRKKPDFGLFPLLAAPGRMALTNYISQSIAGILLFYGLGLGLGCSVGFIYVEMTALLVFILQVFASQWWLRRFRFGPLEWIWRMLTYGRRFPIRQNEKP